MKIPFSVTVARLQNELVDAVLALVARSAASSFKGKSGSLFDAGNDPRPARPSAKRGSGAVAKKPPKRAKIRPAKPTSQLSLFDGIAAAPKPAKDEAPLSNHGGAAFTITDPNALLAEVAPPAPPPASRRRGRKPKSSTLAAPAEPPPAVPAAPTTPALREGEEVAKAVLGGGVVVRRRRT